MIVLGLYVEEKRRRVDASATESARRRDYLAGIRVDWVATQRQQADAVAADPGVGIARADCVFLAFVGAGLAVDAVDDGGVGVDMDGHAFVEEVIGFLFGGGDPLQIFGFVHDGAVVVGVDERVVDEIGHFFYFLVGLGLIPGAFELADLDFVGVRRRGRFFLCKRRSMNREEVRASGRGSDSFEVRLCWSFRGC